MTNIDVKPGPLIEYEVWQNGDWVAGASDRADAEYYLTVYGQDGPVEAKTSFTYRYDGFHDDAPAQPSASVPGEGHGTGVVARERDEAVSLLRKIVETGSDEYDAETEAASIRAFLAKLPPPAASVSMGTSRKASEPIQAVNAELLEAANRVLMGVSEERIDALLEAVRKATALEGGQ
jgi:hypothetical protein